MKTIAILLTVFNRKEKTLLCLQNLFAQHVPEGYELAVYLVNDGCTDGTPEAVQIDFPAVHIIDGDGTLFWNRGMHLAWETAAKFKDYDFYLWLNDDTILEKQALENLLKSAHKKNDQAIIVGTTAALGDKSVITYGGRTQNGKLIVPGTQEIACACFNGNIVLIPQSAYKLNGTNDPVFNHALGDFDYGKRAKKKGIPMYVAPGILGRCDAHESLATWCNPEKSLKQRWKAFRSPLGNNPEQFFVYEKRHNGISKAVFHYMTNHLRVMYPALWKRR